MSREVVPSIDDTHDPARRSWVDAANDPDGDFPIQNLPFGRFRELGQDPDGDDWRIGVAIGDQVLDLAALGLVDTQDMNILMARGEDYHRHLRRRLVAGLSVGGNEQARWAAALRPQASVALGLPCRIGDFTDFYTSIHHARAVGAMFRPEQPLLPNYKWVPIAYHGRSSSIVPSGTAIRRPRGQTFPPGSAVPTVGPSRRLDYELELGALIGRANSLGESVPLADAETHVFGLTLLNDWSARDLQAWEYQPLGPFLAKNFATTLSPWVVTLAALAPFRIPFARQPEDPSPLPYLDSADNRSFGAFDITLEVYLETAHMRRDGMPAIRLSRSNYGDAYWTLAQLVAHHTVNGCNLRSGDLLGTGTLSGPEADQAGSLLELGQGGKSQVALGNGEARIFLEDGDTVGLRGYCTRASFRRIGFGECLGLVLPATGGGNEQT